jgi:hypothetical protein
VPADRPGPASVTVFILYAVVAGLIVGALLGGSPANLGRLTIRWWPLALAGLAVQLVLFSDIGARLVGDLGPAVYLASTLSVLAVVLRNLRLPGLALVAIGAISNLVAIMANGGSMPADPAAIASLGDRVPPSYSNSVVVADPILRPLTDIFAMPAWLPLANVFSLGDVLIGVGIGAAVAAGMRRRPSDVDAPRSVR